MIAKHEPKIWGLIKRDNTNSHNNPYLDGLKAGGKQFEQDKTQTRLNKLNLNKTVPSTKNRGKGKGK
ncbi:MAG: hypothetical protein JNK00_00020 [Flavipsychrobacter sp.]|nr:hypothetical protein [Flavipsychrobacter sp.]